MAHQKLKEAAIEPVDRGAVYIQSSQNIPPLLLSTLQLLLFFQDAVNDNAKKFELKKVC